MFTRVRGGPEERGDCVGRRPRRVSSTKVSGGVGRAEKMLKRGSVRVQQRRDVAVLGLVPAEMPSNLISLRLLFNYVIYHKWNRPFSA